MAYARLENWGGISRRPSEIRRTSAAQEDWLFSDGGTPANAGDAIIGPDVELLSAADIDDLFDPSDVIEALGLEHPPRVPRVIAGSRRRTKWHDAFMSLNNVVLKAVLFKRLSLLKCVLAFLKVQLRESYVVALETT